MESMLQSAMMTITISDPESDSNKELDTAGRLDHSTES